MLSRQLWIVALLLLLMAAPAAAQDDGLNLPAELYILNNRGVVQQYGLGAEGTKTVTPEDQFVLDFGIAPDGNFIAYRTETTLEIRSLADNSSVKSVVLDAEDIPPFRGEGDSIAWSPIGDAVAYTTLYGAKVYFLSDESAVQLREGQFISLSWSPDGRYLAGEQENNIWWVYRRDRNTFLLASAIPSSLGLGWQPNGDLIFAPESGGLFTMNLNAGNTQTTLLDESWVYGLPVVQTDGTIAVFGRQKSDPETSEGFGRLLGLAPDAPQVNNLGEVSIQLAGLHWTPDGKFLVAFQDGLLALANPTNGATFTLPVSGAVTYAWGPLPPPSLEGVTLPTDGFFIADDDNEVAQVWRLPRDGSPPTPITGESVDVTSFGISPDNARVAYSSGDRLLLQAVDGSARVELATLSREEPYPEPVFNLDGSQVIFNDRGLWLVSAAGGDARQIIEEIADLPPTYRHPQFAPNINAALITIASQDGGSIGVLDLTSSEIFDFKLGRDAIWLNDGRLIIYGWGSYVGDNPENIEIYVGNFSVTPTTEELLSLPYINIWDFEETTPGKLRMVWTIPGDGPAITRGADIDLTTAAVTAIGEIGFISNPQLSPDGSFIAGYNHVPQTSVATGQLLLIDLTTGRQYALQTPAIVRGFQWGS